MFSLKSMTKLEDLTVYMRTVVSSDSLFFFRFTMPMPYLPLSVLKCCFVHLSLLHLFSHCQVAASSLLTAVLTPTGVAVPAAGVVSGENTYYRDITFRDIPYFYKISA